MKIQALFSAKDKSKKLKCRLLQFLFGALRVNQTNNGKYLYTQYDFLTKRYLHIVNTNASHKKFTQFKLTLFLIASMNFGWVAGWF